MDIKNECGQYFIENGKIIFYSDILGEYKHEYKNLEEVCEELNGYLKKFNHYSALIDDYNYKIGELAAKDVRA